jgi:hypothetical protein
VCIVLGFYDIVSSTKLKKIYAFLCNHCMCYVSQCLTKLSNSHSYALGYVKMVPVPNYQITSVFRSLRR